MSDSYYDPPEEPNLPECCGECNAESGECQDGYCMCHWSKRDFEDAKADERYARWKEEGRW